MNASLPPILDEVFSTDGLFKRLYEDIAAQSFPAHSRRRIELEPKAVGIEEWSPTVVPGLLQTPGYARALFREGNPRASDAELSNRVGHRIARQEIFRGSSPPDFSVIIGESVIRRRVGNAAIMREQLAALLSHATRPTTVLQVLPLDAGTHGLMDGSMSIPTMAEGQRIIYTEGIRSGAIIEEPAEVCLLERSYDALTASALSRDALSWAGHRGPEWLACLFIAAFTGAAAGRVPPRHSTPPQLILAPTTPPTGAVR
ncbi:DUF5753 domain-containing protein [Streptomyces sp. A5-4]|uniref:DUF5753 domain-containing protein n=1 Tax=Streptomyces sp. A5-4 TaxID=3384771 RepID=UPI003DA827DF